MNRVLLAALAVTLPLGLAGGVLAQPGVQQNAQAAGAGSRLAAVAGE